MQRIPLLPLLGEGGGGKLSGQLVGQAYLQSLTTAVIGKGRGNKTLQVNEYIGFSHRPQLTGRGTAVKLWENSRLMGASRKSARYSCPPSQLEAIFSQLQGKGEGTFHVCCSGCANPSGLHGKIKFSIDSVLHTIHHREGPP